MSSNWTIQVYCTCSAVLNWWHRGLSPKQGWHFCLSATHNRFEQNWQTGGRKKRVRSVPSQSRKEADGLTSKLEWKSYRLWDWAMALEKETEILQGANIDVCTQVKKNNEEERTRWKSSYSVPCKRYPAVDICWAQEDSPTERWQNRLTQHI